CHARQRHLPQSEHAGQSKLDHLTFMARPASRSSNRSDLVEPRVRSSVRCRFGRKQSWMTGTSHTRGGDPNAGHRFEFRQGEAGGGGAQADDGAPVAWSPNRSGHNVIPFARPRYGDVTRATEPSFSADQRSASPRNPGESRIRMISLVALSLAG